jgi:hypothetical protein
MYQAQSNSSNIDFVGKPGIRWMEDSMWKMGCCIGTLGLLLIVVSVFVLGSVAMLFMDSHHVATIPFDSSLEAASEPLIRVDTVRFCQIGVRVTLESWKSTRADSSDTDPRPEYEFPVEYTIADADGNFIHRQASLVTHAGGVHGGMGKHFSTGPGSFINTQWYEKFKVPPPGEIVVHATLQPDRAYGATIRAAEVLVYDNVATYGERLSQGGLVLLAGISLSILGGLIFVLGLVFRKKPARRVPPPPPTIEPT